ARAYRRGLQAREYDELLNLYTGLRKKGMAHAEAFAAVLSRILISPSFLYRVEHAPTGESSQPVSAWELASRLSYTLWATMPDEELRRAAAAGRLHVQKTLPAQVARTRKAAAVPGLVVA